MKKKIMLFITSLIISINLFCITASAATTSAPNDLESSKLVTGAKALFADAFLVISGLSLVICTAFIAYCLVRRMLAKNQEKDDWNGRILTAVICVILIPGLTGTIGVVLKYFL